MTIFNMSNFIDTSLFIIMAVFNETQLATRCFVDIGGHKPRSLTDLKEQD